MVNFEKGVEWLVGDGDPRSETIGEVVSVVPAGVRDQGQEQIFGYGMRAGLWRMRDALDGFGVPATFFVSAHESEKADASGPKHWHSYCGGRREVRALVSRQQSFYVNSNVHFQKFIGLRSQLSTTRIASVPRTRRSPQLHDNIIADLRSMILRCELIPGSRISEKNLCAKFDVSRTPLREALKVLASNGLIELLPNRGAWVPHLQIDDVSEAFDVLALLECRAGELAATSLRDRDLRDLGTLHDRLVAQVACGDTERSIRTDFQVHRKLVVAAGNRALAGIHDGLAVRVERARYIVGTSRSRMLEAVAEHEAILKAVLARDASRVAEEVQRHNMKTRDAVMEAVRTHFSEGLRRAS